MSMSRFQVDRPMNYEELILTVVPEKIRNPAHPKHKALYGLLQEMTRRLEDARMVSTIPADRYTAVSPGNILQNVSDVEKHFRITGIQRQMSAIRFRLDIHDYSGGLEREILRNRLYSLYDQARIIDPDGVGRFERMMDKKMRKARLR